MTPVEKGYENGVRIVSGIALTKDRDFYESRQCIYSFYKSKDGKEYIIKESKEKHVYVCYEKLECDEQQKRRIRSRNTFVDILSSSSNWKYTNGTEYRIQRTQDENHSFLRVVEGYSGIMLFHVNYETFYRRLFK